MATTANTNAFPHCQAELTRGVALIDRDLNQAAGIDIPEGLPERDFAEGPGVVGFGFLSKDQHSSFGRADRL